MQSVSIQQCTFKILSLVGWRLVELMIDDFVGDLVEIAPHRGQFSFFWLFFRKFLERQINFWADLPHSHHTPRGYTLCVMSYSEFTSEFCHNNRIFDVAI
jgi:hypothetical protein